MPTLNKNRLANLHRPRARTGVTLVEMLAAIVLATLLTVAVLGVLKSMVQGRRALLAGMTDEPWHPRLAAQLEWDLTNSRTIRSRPAGFELTGFAGRDFASGLPLHRPTTVRYVFAQVNEQRLLIRGEIHDDALHLNNYRAEIVGVDVGRLLIGPAEGTSAARLTDKPGPQSLIDDGPLPERVAVVLVPADDGQPTFERIFTLK